MSEPRGFFDRLPKLSVPLVNIRARLAKSQAAFARIRALLGKGQFRRRVKVIVSLFMMLAEIGCVTASSALRELSRLSNAAIIVRR